MTFGEGGRAGKQEGVFRTVCPIDMADRNGETGRFQAGTKNPDRRSGALRNATETARRDRDDKGGIGATAAGPDFEHPESPA